MATSIRSYDRSDSEKAFALWERTLRDTWPIEFEFFREVLHGEDGGARHLVAESDGDFVGLLAIGVGGADQPNPRGSIQLAMVDPSHQGQGIGSAMLARGERMLLSHGITDIQAGAGAAAYFWPGVPDNLPGAVRWFEKNGWLLAERSVDLVADLTRSHAVSSAAHWNDAIRIEAANADEVEEVLAFERTHFPDWFPYFELVAARGAFEDMLVARDRDGAITASVLLFGPEDGHAEHSLKWRTLLGSRMGGFGAIGVRPDFRGRGIGLTLARHATEALKARGVRHSYLGWTWLTDWYGKLGYEVWRTYRMGAKRLTAPRSVPRSD